MKNILFLMVIVVLASCSSTKTVEKSQKEQQKAAEEALNNTLFDQAVEALENKDFVLEANRVEFRGGQFAYVSSNTNFVSVKDNRGTVQLAFTGASAGPNGIGGVTVDGTISNVKMNTDKKGNISYSMNIQGTGISATVSFNMLKGSNNCTATVIPNFSGNRISFVGALYPTSESKVFKGRSL